MFFRPRRARPVLLNERGQGLAALLAALGVIFLAIARAKAVL